ncbi:MAG: hypothetical protein QXU74_01445 [Candidatus Aenigmatarchaeota archaeon]
MEFIKNLLGLALIFLSWFNPFALPFSFRLTLFIIGFDLTSWFAKLLLFIINFFFPLLGEQGLFLVWTLLLLVVAEFIFSNFKILKILTTISKPLIIFFSLFFALKDFQLALIIAGIDLILNLKH